MSNLVKQTSFILNKNSYTMEDALSNIEKVLHRVKDGDWELGFNVVQNIDSLSKVSGKALSKLIHGLFYLWKSEGNKEEDFYAKIIGYTSLSTKTLIDRYINAWDAVECAPAKVRDALIENHPTKNLNALGAAIAQGHIPDDKQWDKLADAVLNEEFLVIVREVKGAEPRKNSITLYLEKDGTLVAYSEDVRYLLGQLYVEDKEDEPKIKQALERIVKRSGIIEQGL